MICQNLASSFDFHVRETITAATLKLKVAPPQHPDLCIKSNSASDGHPPTNVINPYLDSTSYDSVEKQSFYTQYPYTRRPRSLQLCTENLGSDPSNFTQPTSSQITVGFEKPKKRITKSNNIPPPLTTMSSLRLCSRREGGRLIVDAVKRDSFLQAERSGGRLRMFYRVVLTSPLSPPQKKKKERDY